jgi:hypothetical protein
MTRKAKSRKSACTSPETTRYGTVFQERACVPLAGWEFDHLHVGARPEPTEHGTLAMNKETSRSVHSENSGMTENTIETRPSLGQEEHRPKEHGSTAK